MYESSEGFGELSAPTSLDNVIRTNALCSDPYVKATAASIVSTNEIKLLFHKSQILIVAALMVSPMHKNTIRMALSILYIKGQ